MTPERAQAIYEAQSICREEEVEVDGETATVHYHLMAPDTYSDGSPIDCDVDVDSLMINGVDVWSDQSDAEQNSIKHYLLTGE